MQLLFMIAARSLSAPQTLPIQSGAMDVVVYVEGTSTPIHDVQVTVTPEGSPGAAAARASTSAAGSAAFESLPTGRYVVRAERDGYVGSGPGSRRRIAPAFGTTSAAVLPGETYRSVLYLRAGGSVRGRIVDEKGSPAVNIRVTASISGYRYGRTALFDGPSSVTDANGEYWIRPLGQGSFTLRLDHPSIHSSPSLQSFVARSASVAHADVEKWRA